MSDVIGIDEFTAESTRGVVISDFIDITGLDGSVMILNDGTDVGASLALVCFTETILPNVWGWLVTGRSGSESVL